MSIEEKPSSPTPAQAAEGQIAIEPNVQTDLQRPRHDFQLSPVPRPASMDDGEVDLVFTGRKAATRQEKVDEYAPVNRLYLASQTRRVTDDEWVAVGKQVAPNRWDQAFS